MAAQGRLSTQHFTPQVAADLLRFCTSDLTPTTTPELGPAPIPAPAPDADHTVAAIHIHAATGSPLATNPRSGQAGFEGPATTAAAAMLPLDLDALRDCRGLPYVTAGGSVRLLGTDR
jgi:hypothetical protein